MYKKMLKLLLKKEYKKYPAYKDSGVEWVSRIPKDWSVLELKYLSYIDTSGIFGEEKGEVLSKVATTAQLSIDGVWNFDKMEHRFFSANEYKKYSTRVGDIIVVKASGSATNIITGKAGYISEIDKGFVFGNFLMRVHAKKEYSEKFLYYFLISDITKKRVELSVSATTYPNLKIPDYLSAKIVFPKIDQQVKIANYLDEKTAIIDQIIGKKQKLIELLREKRTAVINNAILNAVGKIVKIKNHVFVNPSKQAVSTTHLDDTVSFVPMEAISENGDLELQEKKYKEVKDGFTYFRDRDVVLAKITPCYENGKAGVMKGLKNGFGFGTTEFMVLRPKNSILAEYLYYLIFSDKFRKSGEVEMRGTAGQKRVTASFVKKYEFLLPTIERQKEIVEILNKKTILCDLAVKNTEQSIELLNEFKSSLISNFVTGKVKIN